MSSKPKVLFFSTRSAVRSQMAEGFLRTISGKELEAACTAVRPETNPLAAEVMREVGIDLSKDQPREIQELFKEHFACVVTLSDPSRERTPVWPFTRHLYHWDLRDPLETTGSIEEQRAALRQVRDRIAENVRHFASSVAPNLKAKSAAAR
jgi:arsenate reductase (thioredoxin)